MSCVSLFIEDNYDYLLNMANVYVGTSHGGDLLNDLTLAYLEDETKYESMCDEGDLMKYICRTMAICKFSVNTPFYYKYKKHQEQIAHRYPIEILKEKTDEFSKEADDELKRQISHAFSLLKEIRWFDAEVFKSYYLHDHSLRTLSDATGIPKNTLYKSIQAAKEHLQENSERIR